ncbi:hypothetical protein UM396_14645 [Geobacillus subterraneus]|uniref:hypothetical protein n=1 Tax=Geobacillus subterraneus TaxID=129338 RepID=UPI002AC902D7|nr:hypothetical protein [Geobacillus subterraneus]WPZ17821.1 hypothetical protein UM396_14645 [Geobacillus subterraneus]
MKHIIFDGLLISAIVTFALLIGVSIQHLLLIVVLAFALVTIRTLQELTSVVNDVVQAVVYLICVMVKDDKTCGSTAFRVRKDEKGLVVECVDCKTEHEVK